MPSKNSMSGLANSYVKDLLKTQSATVKRCVGFFYDYAENHADRHLDYKYGSCKEEENIPPETKTHLQRGVLAPKGDIKAP